MENFLERQVRKRAEEIKSFIEDKCDSYDIEIDEIKIYVSYTCGTVTVYLEEFCAYNQGVIGQAVKSKWPDIECEYEDVYRIDFTFHI